MALNLIIIGWMILMILVGGCYVAIEEKREKKMTKDIWEW